MSLLVDLTKGNVSLYSYFNKKIGAYQNPIFTSVPKQGIAETCRRACLLQPKEAKLAHLDECDVYYFGAFNDVTGKFELLEKPEFLLSLDQFFPKIQEETPYAE